MTTQHEENRKPSGMKSTQVTQPSEGTGARSAPLAYAGRRVNPNSYQVEYVPEFPDLEDGYIVLEDVDYDDVSKINRQINRARAALFRADRAAALARRQEAVSKAAYRRAFALALIQVSGSSEKQRTAVAELAVGEEYSDFLVAEAVVKETESLVRAIRTELDALAEESRNLRAQMNLQ